MTARETHPATVTNTQDPEQRGRIKVICSGLLGDESQELPQWIPMIPAWGWFSLPDIGEIVEVEATVGSDDDEHFGQSSINNMDLKYRTNRYYGGTETDTPRPVPPDFTSKNYGKRRGFATPKGHIILFDDTDGDERLSITWTNGTEFSYIGIDKDGSMVLGNKRGSVLSLDAKNKQTMLIDEFSNALTFDEAGIHIIDSFGQSFDMRDGVIQAAAEAVTLTCKNAVIDAGQVDLAGATEPCLLGQTFLTLFQNHIHATGMGPSGPALPGAGGNPAPWTAALSQAINVG